MSFEVVSDVRRGVIRATITTPTRQPSPQIHGQGRRGQAGVTTPCGAIHLRLRHPERGRLKSVKVNGAPHRTFDAAKELITIPRPAGEIKIEAFYGE